MNDSADPAPYRALVHPAGRALHRGARPARAAARGRRREDRQRRRRGDGDPDDVGARRAADRRGRRVRARARARSRRIRRRAREGARGARRDATDRRQPPLGARSRARPGAAALPAERADAAWREADAIAAEDEAINFAIGRHGLAVLRELARQRSGPVRVMTHCNAGALATCGWGTATAPLFLAHAEGLPLHVWVSETRPRLQGANLTAWEMARRGVAAYAPARRGERAPHAARRRRRRHRRRRSRRRPTATSATRSAPTRRRSPRTTTAFRSTSRCRRPRSMPGSRPAMRFRSSRAVADEVLAVTGRDGYGQTATVAIAPAGTHAINYAFDVTPARLVTGLVTERGRRCGRSRGAGRRCFRSASSNERRGRRA